MYTIYNHSRILKLIGSKFPFPGFSKFTCSNQNIAPPGLES